MSDEGGLEEVRESFWSWDLSSAISLSLASMMQNLTFFRQGTEEQLGKVGYPVCSCSARLHEHLFCEINGLRKNNRKMSKFSRNMRFMLVL